MICRIMSKREMFTKNLTYIQLNMLKCQCRQKSSVGKDILKMVRVLYNPLACNMRGKERAKEVESLFVGEKFVYEDLTKIERPDDYIDGIPTHETLILAGGDGTISRLADIYDGRAPKRELLYFPTGTGNDFMKDLNFKRDTPILLVRLNEYLVGLPRVSVNGMTKRFFNGVGFGIDGYCCEVGDNVRARRPGKKVNYTAIALGGAAGGFHRTNCTLTVDGVTKKYKKVWLAPAMNGKCYGGGMMIAPDQDRLATDRKCTAVVVHDIGHLTLLILFKSIFTGTHTKYKKYVDIVRGSEISVTFDRPTALQIDGETVRDVLSYSVTSRFDVNEQVDPAEKAPIVI